MRDFAQVRAGGPISESIALEALERLEVDELGLDEVDRKMLIAIIDKFNGGPVGIDTIAAATGEEAETIMRVRQRGGKNASMFLSMPTLRAKVDDLKRAQIEAELRCF